MSKARSHSPTSDGKRAQFMYVGMYVYMLVPMISDDKDI